MKFILPKFKLYDYLIPNILSIVGWFMIVTTFCLVVKEFGIILAKPFQDFWFYAGFYFYNAIFVLVLTLIIFPIELLISHVNNKKILTINIKNIFLKIIYQLMFYIGLIGLYFIYYVLGGVFS